MIPFLTKLVLSKSMKMDHINNILHRYSEVIKVDITTTLQLVSCHKSCRLAVLSQLMQAGIASQDLQDNEDKQKKLFEEYEKKNSASIHLEQNEHVKKGQVDCAIYMNMAPCWFIPAWRRARIRGTRCGT